VTSKPVPAAPAPDVLGRVLLPLRAFLGFTFCPHAGCPVGYDPSQQVLACPCHGSQFNASTGAVEVGPATTGLRKLGIAKGSNGQLYVS